LISVELYQIKLINLNIPRMKKVIPEEYVSLSPKKNFIVELNHPVKDSSHVPFVTALPVMELNFHEFALQVTEYKIIENEFLQFYIAMGETSA